MGAAASSSRASTVMTMLAVLFTILLLRNVASKDYRTETKSYLKSIGKEDSIDKVIPKTATEYRNEKLRANHIIEDLVANVTELQRDVHYLRTEHDKISSQRNDFTNGS